MELSKTGPGRLLRHRYSQQPILAPSHRHNPSLSYVSIQVPARPSRFSRDCLINNTKWRNLEGLFGKLFLAPPYAIKKPDILSGWHTEFRGEKTKTHREILRVSPCNDSPTVTKIRAIPLSPLPQCLNPPNDAENRGAGQYNGRPGSDAQVIREKQPHHA